MYSAAKLLLRCYMRFKHMLQLYYSGLCQVKFRRFSNKACLPSKEALFDRQRSLFLMQNKPCLKTVFNKRRNAWDFRFSKRKKTFIYKIP